VDYNETYILPTSEPAEKKYYSENPDNDPNFEDGVFRVYPNPCLDYFIIEYCFKSIPKDAACSIDDASGRTIEEVKIEGQHNQIIRRVAELSPGLYTIKLVIYGKVVKIAKLTIVK
jgi:hypothetical protein